jgi:Mg-chelatase subunit ChlD
METTAMVSFSYGMCNCTALLLRRSISELYFPVLLDKTQTTVYLPAELADGPMDNPTDSHVIESICYSRLAEPYMIWNYNNNNAHRMYFGSSTGAFRIIPGHHSETCGQFDPRRRPWFVAASSGPKDVVLVIDVSGSMRGSRGSDLAKDAAISVVQTLSLVDRFAIITFSDEARQIGGEQGLIRATNESKTMMIEHIKNLTFIGETNFYDAFATAFDTIEQTIQDELSSNCNVAILFMTDGEISEGYPGEDDTISLVNDRIEHLATNFNRTTTIFTYSLGQYADYQVTKRLACETNGIWTPIDDFTDDLITAMSSYYKLYASGLGQGGNKDWAVWVEPYMFALGGKMGAGVSAPAYDRSVTPPLFLGVAAVDMYMEYYEEALGNKASSSELLDRFVYRSSRVLCPKIELSQCELEAMRSIGGDESRTCGTCNSTVYQANVPKKCPNQNELPSDVWNNTDCKSPLRFCVSACEIPFHQVSGVFSSAALHFSARKEFHRARLL